MSTPTSENPVMQDPLGSSDEKPKKSVTHLADSKWAYVDRNRMGNLKRLPIELIVKSLGYLPFRQRVRMVLQVSKSFQGLMAEKSLWRTVETCKGMDGSALLNMLKPTPFGNSLLPKGSMTELNLEMDERDMQMTSRVLRIEVMQYLHLQNHTLNSLTVKGYWMNAFVYQLWQQAASPPEALRVNLTQITTFELGGFGEMRAYRPPLASQLIDLIKFMPKLVNLRISGHFGQANSAPMAVVDMSVLQEIYIVRPELRTLSLGCWPFSMCALENLGRYFPKLEVFECHIITVRRYKRPGCVFTLPHLKSFTMSGYDNARVNEDKLSNFFIVLIDHALELRELTWKNTFRGPPSVADTEVRRERVDLFEFGKRLCVEERGWGIVSPELRKVVLQGWSDIGEEWVGKKGKLWSCPKAIEAPWII